MARVQPGHYCEHPRTMPSCRRAHPARQVVLPVVGRCPRVSWDADRSWRVGFVCGEGPMDQPTAEAAREQTPFPGPVLR